MKRSTVGIALALTTGVISGVAIFTNAYAVKQVPDAALYTTLKNAFAALLLMPAAVAAVRSGGGGVTVRPGRRVLGAVGLVGIFGGGVAFLLFFSGLALASAPSAAFIHKTMFVWVALLAVPLLREQLSALLIGALGVLLAAQLLIAPPTGVTWGLGETLIGGATLIWALEVILARRLLERVPWPALAGARLGIGLVVLGGYIVVTGRLPLLATLNPTQWAWIALTGGLLAGYVATWFAALSRAPATVVTAVLVIGAPITALLTAAVNGSLPAAPQLAGYSGIALATAVIATLWMRRAAARPVAAVAVSG